MGLGVVEDRKLNHVPGTVILDDGVSNIELAQVTGGLKHAKGKTNNHIVLVPQPSNDPNDPLVRVILCQPYTMRVLTRAELAALAERRLVSHPCLWIRLHRRRPVGYSLRRNTSHG